MYNKRAAVRYCCEDVSKVKNFDKAAADPVNMWEFHHILEIVLGLSTKELKEQDLYYKRPADELILLTKKEHRSLHNTGERSPQYGRRGELSPFFGKPRPQWVRDKISKSHLGKHLSEETKRRVSEAKKGKCAGADHPFFGKHHTEKTRAILSEKSTKKICPLIIYSMYVVQKMPKTAIAKELNISVNTLRRKLAEFSIA